MWLCLRFESDSNSLFRPPEHHWICGNSVRVVGLGSQKHQTAAVALPFRIYRAHPPACALTHAACDSTETKRTWGGGLRQPLSQASPTEYRQVLLMYGCIPAIQWRNISAAHEGRAGDKRPTTTRVKRPRQQGWCITLPLPSATAAIPPEFLFVHVERLHVGLHTASRRHVRVSRTVNLHVAARGKGRGTFFPVSPLCGCGLDWQASETAKCY